MNARSIFIVLEWFGFIALLYEHWTVAVVACVALFIIMKAVDDGQAKRVVLGLGEVILAAAGFCLFPYFTPVGVVLAVTLIIACICIVIRPDNSEVSAPHIFTS